MRISSAPSALTASTDAPTLDSVYKLQEYAGLPRRKRSEEKATWPGRKQVFRRYAAGLMAGDVVALEDEAPGGKPLLRPVMRAGRRTGPDPRLDEIRDRARAARGSLPDALRSLDPAETPHAVETSAGVRALAADADRLSRRVAPALRTESPFD